MSLIEEIDARIEERSLLRHSFYRKWVEGTLPREALKEYARQYYAFESAFPRILSALHARTAEAWARQSLLGNLWDEEHGDENHAELWLRFAEGLGVSRHEVRRAEPNEATKHLLEVYREASWDRPVAAGVAALYAYERQVPGVARVKIEGLRDHYDFEDGPATRFFEEHSTLDEEHSRAEARIVDELGPPDREEVVATAQDALDAWWGFLDAVDVEAPVPA